MHLYARLEVGGLHENDSGAGPAAVALHGYYTAWLLTAIAYLVGGFHKDDSEADGHPDHAAKECLLNSEGPVPSA